MLYELMVIVLAELKVVAGVGMIVVMKKEKQITFDLIPR